jgi:hypothetical protein
VQEVFGFVKKNLSGAQRRNSAASGERGAGKGAAALFLASVCINPGEHQLDGKYLHTVLTPIAQLRPIC